MDKLWKVQRWNEGIAVLESCISQNTAMSKKEADYIFQTAPIIAEILAYKSFGDIV